MSQYDTRSGSSVEVETSDSEYDPAEGTELTIELSDSFIATDTLEVTDVTAFGGRLRGEVIDFPDDEFEDGEVFFRYGTDIDDPLETGRQTITEEGEFEFVVDDFDPQTTVEFRAVSEDPTGNIVTGDVLSFTTVDAVFSGQVTVAGGAAEGADVLVYRPADETVFGSLSTDSTGEYSVSTADVVQGEIVAQSIIFADGEDVYGRTTTVEVGPD